MKHRFGKGKAAAAMADGMSGDDEEGKFDGSEY